MGEWRGDWRDVFRGFRIALDPRKISLGIGGVVLSTVFVFLALLLAFSLGDPRIKAILTQQRGLPALMQEMISILSATFQFQKFTLQRFTFYNLQEMISILKSAITYFENLPPLAYILTGFIALAAWLVWAYFGGAISRIAAVEVARDERIELGEAAKFARSKYRSLFWAPIAVVLAILFFGLCNAVVGLIGRIPMGIGQFLVSVPLIFALFSGFLMALLLIGLVVGSPLMVPTICVEGTDSFDAISRSISYIYARPWRYIWYKLVAIAYGIPCAIFVICFTGLFMKLGLCAGRLGMGRTAFNELWNFCFNGALPPTTLGMVAGVIFSVWIYLAIAAVLGYVVSYIFTSNTIIYMLLRKAEDGTEMTEVYEEKEEETWESSGTEEETKSEEPKAEKEESKEE